MPELSTMRPAERVVIRTKPDYTFEVDGSEFPWYITDKGPGVTRFAEHLYGVSVEILCIDRETKDELTVTADGYLGRRLSIGGREFPWLITSDGYTFRAGLKIAPTVALTFLARDVDYDGFIDDTDVLDIDGYLWVATNFTGPIGPNTVMETDELTAKLAQAQAQARRNEQ